MIVGKGTTGARPSTLALEKLFRRPGQVRLFITSWLSGHTDDLMEWQHLKPWNTQNKGHTLLKTVETLKYHSELFVCVFLEWLGCTSIESLSCLPGLHMQSHLPQRVCGAGHGRQHRLETASHGSLDDPHFDLKLGSLVIGTIHCWLENEWIHRLSN